MSRRTHLIVLVVLSAGIFSSNSVLADSFAAARVQAEANWAKAQNDYFKGLYSGEASTPEQQEALKQKTVGAAGVQLNQVISQQWSQAYQIEQQRSPADDRKDFEAPSAWSRLVSALGGKSAPASSGGENGGSDVVDSSGPSIAAPAVNTPKPGYVLDGSGLPRILEFSGKKKAAPKGN